MDNSTLSADANLTAYGLTMDFSEFTLTTNGNKFSVSQDNGTSTLRNGTIDGDVDMTVGSGEIVFNNMVITGSLNNGSHPVSIADGEYGDISTGAGKVTITGGNFVGTLSGDNIEIMGGNFAEKPDKKYLPDGYTVLDCNETIDGVTYKYKVAKIYTIKFVNDDGTELQSSEIEYGTKPAYTGATPTKKADAQYTYTFKGWDKEISAVTGAATYTATYDSTVNKYNVKFVNDDGTELQSSEIEYGTNKTFADVFTSDTVCVATGLDFPDALAGGVFAAQQKAPLLLANDTLKDVHKNYLTEKNAHTFYVFGGTGAVPDKLVTEITALSK